MFVRAILAVCLLTLAACAGPNPLTLQAREAFFVKDTQIAWEVEDSKVAADPAYIEKKKDFVARLEAAIDERFRDSPSGPEGIVFKVVVDRFSASAAGGSVRAQVHVLRASDGAELGVYKNVVGLQTAGGGLLGVAIQAAIIKPDVVGIMSQSFATNLQARFNAKK
jgi:hypothetical protein